MQQIKHLLNGQAQLVPDKVARHLLGDIRKLRSGELKNNGNNCAGMSSGNFKNSETNDLLTYGSTEFKVLKYINHVAGVRSSVSGSVSFTDLEPGSAAPKILIPYQFSGLVTAPLDVRQAMVKACFFERMFKNFFDFLMLPITALLHSWDSLRETILSDGDPSNVVSAYKGDTFLSEKKAEINSGYNPLIPVNFLPQMSASNYHDVLPEEAGLAVFITTLSEPTRVWQLTDSNRLLSLHIGERENLAGWQIPADVNMVAVKWMSKDDGYQYNDGECYGSFMICEKKINIKIKKHDNDYKN